MRAGLGLLLGAVACTSTTGPAAEPTASASGPAFVVVHDRAALLGALRPHRGEPLLLDVTAAWCMPCVDLQRRTFADPRVRATLADHLWIALDVSAGTPEQLALQGQLGGDTLPHVLRYADTATLLDALEDGAAAPTPALELRMFVAPDELLQQLLEARAVETHQ